ncbi:MAG: EAL domain-containing protein [Oleiphilaceae bacterium]|nr:EAL domain-containing protein [Oleiphilaceae bacterium]
MKLRLKLQSRYIIATLSLLVVMVLANSIIHFWVFEQHSRTLLEELSSHNAASLNQQLEKRGDNMLNYLSDTLYDPMYVFSLEGVNEVIEPILNTPEVRKVVVFDSDGNIFHDGTEELASFGQPIDNAALLAAVLTQQQRFKQTQQDQMTMAAPVMAGDALQGGVSIVLGLEGIQRDSERISQLISSIEAKQRQEARELFTLLDIAVVIVGLVIAALIARSMIKPLRELMNFAEQVGRGDFRSKSQVQRDDELGDLAQALNDMGRKLEARNREISHLAYHDPLTNLPNRFSLIRFIDEQINDHEDQPFTVLFVDLDEFKNVNDNLGHEAGDKLLQIVADRLSSALRPGRFSEDEGQYARPGDVVARLGGDEFLIYLNDVHHPSQIRGIAQRLFEVIRRPVRIGEEEVLISGSVGSATYPEHGRHAHELIKHADIAMYEAKRAGKNTVRLFTEELNLQIEERHHIERELRKAIEDLEQFELWYQPQFEVNSSRLIGAEALIRWRHPEQGLVRPDQFIPAAEMSGLIIPIGDWIIESVCRQLDEWRTQLPEHFHVALNLSARQMYRQNLAGQFSQYLSKYNIPANLLHAEITETMLMIDEEEAARTVKALQKQGIQVWLDDFGTGYSSLNNIRNYSVDGLKIDRSFVMHMDQNPQDRALSLAIISMAQNLDLPVVAEGVETQTQLDILKEYACTFSQGYLHSKPLPAAEFYATFLAPSQTSSIQSD